LVTGKSKTCVWRWQERFAAERIEGLVRDKTRPSRVKPLQTLIERVIALTATEPRHEVTHWTSAALAKAVGVIALSMQRIWRAPRSRPAPTASLQALQESRRRGQSKSYSWLHADKA
jgi:leucine-zipper of insertion element IS481